MIKDNLEQPRCDFKVRSKSYRYNLGKYLEGWEVSDHVSDDWKFWLLVTWYLKYSRITFIAAFLALIYLLWDLA